MNGLRKLIREVHRRSLWQVLTIYVVAGWIAIQVVQTLTESLGLPEWFPSFAVVLLIVGLPIVLATAFVQEGVGRGEEAAPGPSRGTPAPGPEPAAPAAGETGQGSPRLFTWRRALGGGAAAALLWGGVAAAWLLLGSDRGVVEGETPPAADAGFERSIAVLPFDNLSPDPEADRYFSDGVHEEILTELSRIAGLKVISRTSVLAYRDTEKNVRQIGDELGVATILEGSVRRAGERVRITAQLIDAESDAHLWADTYDGDLGDIFTIQGDVARAIARALEAELSPEEERTLDRGPTESLEAYDLYLRGNEARQRAETGEFQVHARRAIDLYRRAVEADPDFASAWARLGMLETELYADAFDVSAGQRRTAEEAVSRAVESDPANADARLASAWFRLRIEDDVEGARRELAAALELRRSDAEALGSLAFTEREYYGRHDRARQLLERALELDPLSPRWAVALAMLHLDTHDYAAARGAAARAVELAPGDPGPRVVMADIALAETGDAAAARAHLRTAVELAGARAVGRALAENGDLALLAVGEDLALLDSISPADFGGDRIGVGWYHEAVAYRHRRAGRAEEARQAFELAAAEFRAVADGELPMLAEIFVHGSLARQLAAAGRWAEAEREIESALTAAGPAVVLAGEGAPPARRGRLERARAAAAAGRAGEAVAILETLLDVPSKASVGGLRLSPYWDPIRDDPAFQRLIARR